MVASFPIWIEELDSEELLCQACSHHAERHIAVVGPDGTVTHPCGEEERYDVDSDGQMILTDEPCGCEDFENND